MNIHASAHTHPSASRLLHDHYPPHAYADAYYAGTRRPPVPGVGMGLSQLGPRRQLLLLVMDSPFTRSATLARYKENYEVLNPK